MYKNNLELLFLQILNLQFQKIFFFRKLQKLATSSDLEVGIQSTVLIFFLLSSNSVHVQKINVSAHILYFYCNFQQQQLCNHPKQFLLHTCLRIIKTENYNHHCAIKCHGYTSFCSPLAKGSLRSFNLCFHRTNIGIPFNYG